MIGDGGEKTYDWGRRGKDISLGTEGKRHMIGDGGEKTCDWGRRGKDI